MHGPKSLMDRDKVLDILWILRLRLRMTMRRAKKADPSPKRARDDKSGAIETFEEIP
jgi:hypothetical protein